MTQANEKYKGDALLQKVYTVDFLSKKKKVNRGEVPQYYVEGNHEPIIDPAIFDNVQALIKLRRSEGKRNSCVSIFSSKIKCGDCGSWYGSKVWHSNDKYRRVVWQCNHKFDREKKCSTVHLEEETIQIAFLKALNRFCVEKDEILAVFKEIKWVLCENGCGNEAEHKASTEQIDQTGTKQRYGEMMQKVVETLEGRAEIVDCFDKETWFALVDYMTVFGRDMVCFTFKNGAEIKVSI